MLSFISEHGNYICYSVFVSQKRNCTGLLCHLLQTWSVWPYSVKLSGSVERYLDFSCAIISPSGNVIIITCTVKNCGPGGSVGIATDYGLDGAGSNPGGDEIFRPSRPALGAHSPSCKMDIRSFPGVKCGRGVLLITHTLLVPRSWKVRAISLPTLWATPGL